MNLTKKMFFEKNEQWNLVTFYRIYMEAGIKQIQIIGKTDREDRGKNYLSWICSDYEEECCMPIDKFLEWDVFYQLKMLTENMEDADYEVEPWECYEQANTWIKGDGDGSVNLCLTKLTINTPCGYYYY